MEKYNYYQAVLDDVKEHIENEENLDDYSTAEEFEDHLNEILWIDDAVTGNGSGSYTFSTYQAEENLCHNLDLFAEMIQEFGGSAEELLNSPEAADVSIRCYLLGSAISEAIEEISDHWEN